MAIFLLLSSFLSLESRECSGHCFKRAIYKRDEWANGGSEKVEEEKKNVPKAVSWIGIPKVIVKMIILKQDCPLDKHML